MTYAHPTLLICRGLDMVALDLDRADGGHPHKGMRRMVNAHPPLWNAPVELLIASWLPDGLALLVDGQTFTAIDTRHRPARAYVCEVPGPFPHELALIDELNRESREP